ncbi:MAG: branched chain amino acid aminotransferase, partial [Taibaiella sp.]|nr:branched chain amino acid aminotransferase [Taibaiella sp.]
MDVFTLDISIKKTGNSRLNELDKNNIEFGKVYSDHMLVADYVDGAWNKAEIIPYGNMSMSPATSFF